MPVQAEISHRQYIGNNSDTLRYEIPFYFLAKGDLVVVVTDAIGEEQTLVADTDYQLHGEETGGPYTISTIVPVPPTSTISIYREPEATQLAEFQGTGRLPASTLTDGLDRLTMLVQSLQRKVERCLRVTDSSPGMAALPGGLRASRLLGFDENGGTLFYDRAALLDILTLEASLFDAPTAFWSTDSSRAARSPDFNGQLGLQLDDSSLWRSTGNSPGQWTLLALDEDTFTSNSDRRPPTQQSVKAYVDDQAAAAESEAVTTANSYTDTKVSTHLPPGSIIPYGGSTAPSGWLLCHGQTVSRTTYASLFGVLGTTYGSGDGSTTFGLPDLRGRVIAGKDDMGGTAANRITNSGTGNPGLNGASLGASGGTDRHTLTILQMPSHNHTVVDARPAAAGSSFGAWAETGSATRTTLNAGGGEAHPNLQPTLILNYIVRI